MDLPSFLRSLDFTDGEIRAYIALLENGPSTVGPILKATHISQSKIYDILERLIQKGVVTYTIAGSYKVFSAADPRLLGDFIEGREVELAKRKRELARLLPQIEAMLKKADYEVAIFEGLRGFKSAYTEMFECLGKGDEYVFFAVSGLEKYEKLATFFRQFHMKRQRKGFTVRGISYPSTKKTMEKIFRRLSGWEIRYTNIPLPFQTVIYKDTILLLNWSEKPAIFKIRCEKIAEDYMKFFESVWMMAERSPRSTRSHIRDIIPRVPA
ncbi:MAG: hypothetical protein GXO64_03440 [Candidatus Micrarchaeota archaeon]|nr:hypothetical protein [Candidatus Micrarchaeota archaeon]